MGFPSMHKTLYSVFAYKRTKTTQDIMPPMVQEKNVEARMEHSCCNRNTFNILM